MRLRALAPLRRGRSPRSRRGASAPLALRLPASAIALLLLLPVLYLVVRSASLGLDGALDYLARPRTIGVLIRTIALAVGTTAASVLVGVPIAWLTTRTDLPARRLWLVLTTLPLGVPSFVGGYAIVAALGPRGMVQQLLEGPFGVVRLPEIYGYPGALLALTLFSFPYVSLSVRATLKGLDPALEESARSLGHGPGAVFFRLTLPLLRPAITAGALLVALYALSDFGAVSLLQFDSFTRVIYQQYTASLDRSGAALLALMLVALTATILVLESRTRGGARYHRVGSGAGRRAPRVALGRWRWPALLFCAGVVGASLLMPLAVLLFWLLRGLSAGEPLLSLWLATRNSLLASALAAGTAALVALPIAFWAVRYPTLGSRLAARVAYLGYALPGVVVALALVFFGARYVPWLYQSLAMLIFAYLVRFLPQALGAVEGALLQIDPRVEEAARSLGRGSLSVLARITLPLARGGVVNAAALVFLTTIKELPATLLLAPIGFETLATSIWSPAAEGFFARAAAPALLLLLFSALSLFPLLSATRD